MGKGKRNRKKRQVEERKGRAKADHGRAHDGCGHLPPHTLHGFFDEPTPETRWKKILKLAKKEYESFQMLFNIETMALLEHWKEPQPERLHELLDLTLQGTHIAVPGDRLTTGLLYPIWPLEMAKYDVLLYRVFLENDEPKKYFMTWNKLYSTALVQTWWAFETLMNDVAGIIAEQRKDTLSEGELLLLNDRAVNLNSKGELEETEAWQRLEERCLFIFRLLTGTAMDRGSNDWQRVMTLKKARDAYQHRTGKDEPGAMKTAGYSLKKTTVIDGMAGVQAVLARVFRETPEFAAKFAYRYLAFWCCETPSPIVWDGHQGDFHLGQVRMTPHDILVAFAPMVSTMQPVPNDVLKQHHAESSQDQDPPSPTSATGDS